MLSLSRALLLLVILVVSAQPLLLSAAEPTRAPGLLQRITRRARADTMKLAHGAIDGLIRLDDLRCRGDALLGRFSRRAGGALGKLGRNVAQVDATGRMVCGFMLLAQAGFDARLNDGQRRAYVDKASRVLRGLPIATKFLQTVSNTAGVADSVLTPEQREQRWAQTLRTLVGELRTATQTQVAPIPDHQLRRWVGRPELPLGRDNLIAAGSIAQVHRLRLPTSDGERDVALKVLKPGLDRNVELTARAVADGFSILQAMISSRRVFPDLQPRSRETLRAVLETSGSVFPPYVDGFKAEGDLKQELLTMTRFRRIFSHDSHVLVPKPYPGLSDDKVLAMAMAHGDSLSGHLERYQRAQEARKAPLPRGPLAAGVTGKDQAVERARIYARQRYGLEPVGDPIVNRSATGYEVRLRFEHATQPGAVIRVADRGAISARGVVPDLSARGIRRLRRELIGSFLWSALRGQIHGDPTQGNIRVLPDGKTLAYLDLGNVARVPLGETRAVLGALKGLATSNTPQATRSLLRASEAYRNMDQRQRRDAERAVVKVMNHVMVAAKTRSAEELRRTWPEMVGQLHRAGVQPSPGELVLLRSVWTLVGDIYEIDRVVPRRRGPLAGLGGALRAGADLVCRASRRLVPGLGARTVAAKDRRAQRLYEEACSLKRELAAP